MVSGSALRSPSFEAACGDAFALEPTRRGWRSVGCAGATPEGTPPGCLCPSQGESGIALLLRSPSPPPPNDTSHQTGGGGGGGGGSRRDGAPGPPRFPALRGAEGPAPAGVA